jgi:hypothetical protein
VNRKPFFLKAMLGATGLMALALTASGATVYYNNFDSGPASLTGFSIYRDNQRFVSSSVGVDAGQVRFDQGDGITYASFDTASFSRPYSPILKNNPGTVTWAFNVSNMDGGPMTNNWFFFSPVSDFPREQWADTGTSFGGGGYVGDRMEFYNWGPGTPYQLLFDIPSDQGLGTLPQKGSFRITYEPSTDLWSVFGEFGTDYVDPTTVTNLLGSAVDGSFTTVSQRYMAFGGSWFGSDFFDNISVSVVPEPCTATLVILGFATWASKLFRRRSIPVRH